MHLRFSLSFPLSVLLLTLGLTGCKFGSSSKEESSESADTSAVSAAKPSFEELQNYFTLTRTAMSRDLVRKFLNEVFAEELTLTPELMTKYGITSPDGKAVKSEFTESHFLQILMSNLAVKGAVEAYLADPLSLFDPDKKLDAQGNPLDEAGKKALSVKRTAWRKQFRDFVKNNKIAEQLKALNDPFQPLELVTPDGSPGYSDAKLAATTGTGTFKNADMKNTWLNFIKEAKKEIILNVFDFDLKDIAQVLVDKKRAGLNVRVGIDGGNVVNRPEVKEVFDLLQAGGVTVLAVDSVGLNHQKMVARDWSTADGAVLLSSGNLTQSCIGPEGDLIGKEALLANPADAKYSVPNANHLIILKSRLLANVVNNELSKTIDLKLKGRSYPQSGMYRVSGAMKADGKPATVTIAFSPRGGYGDLNRDFIKQVIRTTSGPVKMLQFAFSSKTIEGALYERAQAEKAAGRKFDFKSVGDTPFAMRDWSIFLSMAGYRLDDTAVSAGTAPFYKEDVTTVLNPVKPANPSFRWAEVVNQNEFRVGIKNAPAAFGMRSVKLKDGTSAHLTGKIHHKVLMSGGIAIIGTSFNFSENALTNQEQLVATDDPILYKAAEGMFNDLYNTSSETVAAKVAYRNDPKNGWKAGGEKSTDKEDIAVENAPK